MASITFWVGEQPTTPMVVTVRNSDGTIRDLTGVDSVEFIGDPLPDGTASIANAVQGKVQYDFDAPFTEAANLQVQIEMTEGVDNDRSLPFIINVADPSEVVTTIISPAQVEGWTGVSVSNTDVVRAQGLVSLACGRDLTDADWLAGVWETDLFWLRQAVAWQASERPEGSTTSVTMPYIPGASSISNGDVSVSYFANGASDMASLASNTRLALKRLTWMRSPRSESARPFLTPRTQPNPWVLVYQGNRV